MNQSKTRSYRLLGVLLLASTVLTGCDQQQGFQAAQTLLPALTNLSQNGSTSGLSSSATSGALGTNAGTQNGGLQSNDGSSAYTGSNATMAEVGRLLEAAARKYNIPEDTLKAVAWQESTWRPDASSYDGGHGKGVMQIDDRYHQFARTEAVWDAAKNIDYGANYLAELYADEGEWDDALERYNGGSSYPGKINRWAQERPWTQVA